MVSGTIQWSTLKTLESILDDKSIAILDANIILGVHSAGRKPSKEKRDIRRERKSGLETEHVKKVIDHIKSKGTGNYVVIIPDFIRDQAYNVLYATQSANVEVLNEWINKVDNNNFAFVYFLSTEYKNLKKNWGKFLHHEKRLPASWQEVVKPIPVRETGRIANVVVDRSLIYTALHIKDNFIDTNLAIVSDDRTHINTGQMLTKLNNYCRKHCGKFKLMKGSNFYKELRGNNKK